MKSFLKVMIFFLSLLTFSFTVFAEQNSFSPEQTIQIQTIVRDYLVKNPQVLLEAARSLQQQEEAMVQGQAKKVALSHTKELFNSTTSPVIGNANGDVTLVEFQDYQCGYCKKMSEPLLQVIKDDSKIRLVIKELPIFGATSQFAAQAALAAQKQGRYLALHKALLNTSSRLTESLVLDIAQKAGVNTDQLKKDMDSKAYTDEIENNISLANQIGVRGTPSFIVASNIDNPAKIRLVYIPGFTNEATLKQIIKQVRK